MTITGPDVRSGGPGQGVVDAALLLLERMGLTAADLLAAPAATPVAPTFAEYIPVVSALVSEGCHRVYGLLRDQLDRGVEVVHNPVPDLRFGLGFGELGLSQQG